MKDVLQRMENWENESHGLSAWRPEMLALLKDAAVEVRRLRRIRNRRLPREGATRIGRPTKVPKPHAMESEDVLARMDRWPQSKRDQELDALIRDAAAEIRDHRFRKSNILRLETEGHLPPLDLRRRRADQITAMVMEVIRHYLFLDRDDKYAERYIVRDLVEAFCNSGAELITDEVRAQSGLPPRDHLGWTSDEIRELEARRMEVMRQPMVFPDLRSRVEIISNPIRQE